MVSSGTYSLLASYRRNRRMRSFVSKSQVQKLPKLVPDPHQEDSKPKPGRHVSVVTDDPEVAPSPATHKPIQTARKPHNLRNGYQTIVEHVPMKFTSGPSMEDYPGDRRHSGGEVGLPPIGPRARPPSSTSRPSSRGSYVKQHEKPPMISVDTAEGRQRRAHISPTSNSSNNTGSGSNKDANSSFMKFRARSWCATEQNAGPSPRLETLAERNAVNVSHINGVSVSNTSRLMPRTRRLSSNSSNPNSFSKTKRAKSYGNLTKLSDNSSKNNNTNTNPNSTRRTGLNRYGSDQNLSRKDSLVAPAPGSQGGPGNTTSRLSVGARTRTMVTERTQGGGLRHVRSQPIIKQGATTTAANGAGDSAEAESDESDSEKHNRILQWLIGVEASAEPPIEPEIEESVPAQTDTAIHIVYQENH